MKELTLSNLKPGTNLLHYKGGRYVILNLAIHTETGEVLVVYQDRDEPTEIWVRPADMFLDKIGTFSNIPRFKIED